MKTKKKSKFRLPLLVVVAAVGLFTFFKGGKNVADKFFFQKKSYTRQKLA
ncbi:MAG: hypothetical protein K6G65_04540 [Lachnospiraceae bacterium]|nr:hypothetical protein [Lachnospiraceae bacterium]